MKFVQGVVPLTLAAQAGAYVLSLLVLDCWQWSGLFLACAYLCYGTCS